MSVQLLPGHGRYSNSYIINGMLIDAGATPIEIEPYKDLIKYIIITHRHFDHLMYLAKAVHMTGAEVLIHEEDALSLTDENICLSGSFGERAPGIHPTRFLQEGDIINDLEVIYTPGHTIGGICLYDAASKSLISGDTVFSGGEYGRYDLPTGDRSALIASIEKLQGFSVDKIYCGHGLPALGNGDMIIKRAYHNITMGY